MISRAATFLSGSRHHDEEPPRPIEEVEFVEPAFMREPFMNPAIFDREIRGGAHVFGSECCRAEHFLLPLFVHWCDQIGCSPRFHRKLWEFVYILQVLHERGFLRAGVRGLGVAPVEDPLPSYFARLGIETAVADLGAPRGNGAGQAAADQPAGTGTVFPNDLRGFDFCWSTCTMAHLGSIEAGNQFLTAGIETLRPGGLSIHITEFNVKSDKKTVDNRGTVIFRKRDLKDVIGQLRRDGHEVGPMNFYCGSHILDHYVDMPPYRNDPHLKLLLLNYTVTSFGIVVQKRAAPVS